MTTEETAKRTKTGYFIEYVCPIDAYGNQSFYYQLVRTKDCAILYANEDIGATRHAMSDKELNELYKRLENFIADCTIEEAKENRDAFVKVQTLIHQRIRENKK